MKVLDLGAGAEPSEWVPGADVCEHNLDFPTYGEPTDRKAFSDLEEVDWYIRNVSGEKYDLVFMTWSLRYNGACGTEEGEGTGMPLLIDQLKRITNVGAIIEVVDHLEDPYNSKNYRLTHADYYRKYLKHFRDNGFALDCELLDEVTHTIMLRFRRK